MRSKLPQSKAMEEFAPKESMNHSGDFVSAKANGILCDADVVCCSTVSSVCMEDSSHYQGHEQLSTESMSSYSTTRVLESLKNTMPSVEDGTNSSPMKSPAKKIHSRETFPRCVKKLKFSKRGAQNQYLSLSHYMYERVIAGQCVEVFNPVSLSYMTVRKVSSQSMFQDRLSINSLKDQEPQQLVHDAQCQHECESNNDGENSCVTLVDGHSDMVVDSTCPRKTQAFPMVWPKTKSACKLKIRSRKTFVNRSASGRGCRSSRMRVNDISGLSAKRMERKLLSGDVQDRRKRRKNCPSLFVYDNFSVSAGGCNSHRTLGASPLQGYVGKGIPVRDLALQARRHMGSVLF